MTGGWARWLDLLVLFGFGWVAILLELVPLRDAASGLPSPDFLFCVAAFLALRRPRSTPAGAILLLGLVRDLVGGGPAGLGALALLGAVEGVRALRKRLRRRAAVYEFGAVALAALAMTAAEAGLLALTFASPPPLDLLALRVAATALAYVLVFALFRGALQVGYEGARARLARRSP